MRVIPRLLTWGFFAAILTVFGMGVFHLVPIRPALTLDGKWRFAALSPDGALLLTQSAIKVDEYDDVSVWDTRSGRIMRSFQSSQMILSLGDNRHFARFDANDGMYIVDWHTGNEWDCQIKSNLVHLDEYQKRWLTVFGELKGEGPSGHDYLLDVQDSRVVRRLDHTLLKIAKGGRFVAGLSHEKTLIIEETESGRQIASLPRPTNSNGDERDLYLFPDDGNWLIEAIEPQFHQFDGQLETLEPRVFCRRAKTFDIWELANGKRCWRLESKEKELRSLLVSPDGGTLATWPTTMDGGELELFDMATGRKLLAVSLRQGELAMSAEFSPDGGLILLHYGRQNFDRLAMFEVATGRALWQGSRAEYTRFFDSARVLLHVGGMEPLQILDARTGHVVRQFDLAPSGLFYFTPDQRFAAMAGYRTTKGTKSVESLLNKWLMRGWDPDQCFAFVVDLKNGLIPIQVPLPSDQGYYRVSETGATLVTIDRKRAVIDSPETIMVWDVTRFHDRVWAWAASLTLGVLWLLIRGLRSRRNQPQPTPLGTISSKGLRARA